MLDDEATELLRRHARRGQCPPCCMLVDRSNLEREIGATRARDLDIWVEMNGGWVLPARNARASDLQYALLQGSARIRRLTESEPQRAEAQRGPTTCAGAWLETVLRQLQEIDRLQDVPPDEGRKDS